MQSLEIFIYIYVAVAVVLSHYSYSTQSLVIKFFKLVHPAVLTPHTEGGCPMVSIVFYSQGTLPKLKY